MSPTWSPVPTEADSRDDTSTCVRAETRRHDRFALAIVAIATVALLWRVAYVLWMRNRPVLGDGWAYHLWTLDFVDGRAPIVSSHPPAWTLLLSGATILGLRSWLSHQLLAVIVGTATVVMTGYAGRAAFGRRVGLISAGLAAIYPGTWLYEREILSEPLTMLGVATTIWLAYRFRQSPTLGRAIALGALVGVLAMTRSELIATSLFLVAPLVLSACRGHLARGLQWLAAAAIACVVVIAPWAAYNQVRFERFSPLSTGLGATMVSGNCDDTYGGARLGYYDLACAVRFPGTSDNLAVRDGQTRRHAFAYMREHRSRLPIVMAARLGRTFDLYRPIQQTHFETERNTSILVLDLALVSYWILLPFAAVGVVSARRREIPVYPLLAFPLVSVISVLLTFGAVRYRSPAEIPLILLAALGLDVAFSALRRMRGAAVAHSPTA